MKSDELNITRPCTEDWSGMKTLGCKRHCASCDKSVHDLSTLTERQARKLPPGSCVRATLTGDGSVRFAQPKRRRWARAMVLAAGALAGVPAIAGSAANTASTDSPGLVERALNWVSDSVVSVATPTPFIMGEIAPLQDNAVTNQTPEVLDVRCEHGGQQLLRPGDSATLWSDIGSPCTATMLGRDLSTTWTETDVTCTYVGATLRCGLPYKAPSTGMIPEVR